jgi:hypothetical protein
MPQSKKSSFRSSGNTYKYTNPTGPTMPTPVTVSHQTSFGQSLKAGFGLGLGGSIARNLFGPCNPGSVAERPTETVRVVHTNQAYTKCLEEKGDKEECDKYKT